MHVSGTEGAGYLCFGEARCALLDEAGAERLFHRRAMRREIGVDAGCVLQTQLDHVVSERRAALPQRHAIVLGGRRDAAAAQQRDQGDKKRRISTQPRHALADS